MLAASQKNINLTHFNTARLDTFQHNKFKSLQALLLMRNLITLSIA